MNPITPPDVLAQLENDTDPTVREGIPMNPINRSEEQLAIDRQLRNESILLPTPEEIHVMERLKAQIDRLKELKEQKDRAISEANENNAAKAKAVATALAEKDRVIAEQAQVIAEKDEALAEKDQANADLAKENAELKKRLGIDE